jgi:fibro-slime domain-containing protein
MTGKGLAVLVICGLTPNALAEILVPCQVLDFRAEHPDFRGGASRRVSGNVAETLDMARVIPQFSGGGHRIRQEWSDEHGRHMAPHLYMSAGEDACGNLVTDAAGRADRPDHAGITGFEAWWKHTVGENVSLPLALEMKQFGGEHGGGFGFVPEPNYEFYPIDDQGFGNEKGRHNTDFTLSLGVEFRYEECRGQGIGVETDGDLWIFVDGRLVIDLQSSGNVEAQYVSFDRLGLEHDEIYRINLFYANRRAQSNLAFKVYEAEITSLPIAAGGGCD